MWFSVQKMAMKASLWYDNQKISVIQKEKKKAISIINMDMKWFGTRSNIHRSM